VKWSDKIECSEIKTSISSTCQMSSSSSKSASTTSYTYGIPGSQVTIILNKSGNHSLALSRGSNSKTSSSIPAPVGQPFCKVCFDAGLSVADYTDHFVKDQPGPNGKVVCPTLLAQKCLKCGVAGHTSSYCPQEARRERERKEREHETRRMNVNANDVNGWKVVGGAASIPVPLTSSSKPQIKTAAPPPVARGSFGLLAVDEPSDDSEYEREQEEVRNTPAGVPKPVVKERPILTGPPPAVEPAKPLTWAQRAASAATKTPSSSSSSSSTSSANVHLPQRKLRLHLPQIIAGMPHQLRTKVRSSESRNRLLSLRKWGAAGVRVRVR
jgi:hypothetical protein